MAGTFVIAQGGGPTAVINQTMVGAALEVRRQHPGAKVLGALHGVRGIRDGNYVDLTEIPEAELRRIAGTMTCGLPLTSRMSGVAQVSISSRATRQSSRPSRLSSAVMNEPSPFR